MLITDFNTHFSSYEGISALVRNYHFHDIVETVCRIVNVDSTTLLNHPMGGYSKGKTNGAYKYVLLDLVKNISRYDQVYKMLADETSKRVFTYLIQFRLIPDMQFVRLAYDKEHPQYFDKNIVNCTEEEVFVDCGGFTGDTAETFIQQYRNYKKIYIYEPSDDNIALCRSNTEKYPDITVRNCGVGEKNELLPIANSESASSFTGTVDSDCMIPIISLDEDITEKVTFIKMDIEGFEIPALIGARNHIKNDSPKLAICTYHVVSDMWEIPLLIHSINPDYEYYFRHYMPDQNWETVVYAIPKSEPRSKKTVLRKPVTAAALSLDHGWRNVELTKDCGLIPYLLHKNHSMEVTMTGAAREDYPYLETYVKGLHMDFLETGNDEEKTEYILQNGKNIDLLLLRGAFDSNIEPAILYKKVNPAGKIYLGLDANSYWMDSILWDNDRFKNFMSSCDVIATSCRAMQKHLNEKWPWNIEYIPNGYYDWNSRQITPDFSKKENIILTVSRLGTPQKATDVLLEAFALAADKIPDWKLRLIGSIEENFQSYIEDYFKRYPQLIHRVEFTGVIADKECLFAEYQKAKIFTLTSVREGGTPNVIAEALTAGCVTAVTKFDAWEDSIDVGRCGAAAEINDISGISDMYLTLCNNSNLEALSDNAYQYALKNFDMERIVSKLYEMLFGGDFA